MIPDSFDPLMGLDHAKDKGTHDVPASSSPVSRTPVDVQQNDSTANLGTTYTTIESTTVNGPALAGEERQPADVDRFNGGSV